MLRYIFFPGRAALPYAILLLAIPSGIALKYTNQGPIPVFIVNFLAILPCTRIVIMASDELIVWTKDFIGVLISVTFRYIYPSFTSTRTGINLSRNSAQLILSVFLLKSNQLATLQTSLLGGILANSLLMLPLGFTGGGYDRSQQFYNVTLIRTNMSLSLISTATLLVVAVSAQNPRLNEQSLASQSRGVSFLMLGTYLAYLWFGLKTHKGFFQESAKKVTRRRREREIVYDDVWKALGIAGGTAAAAAGGRGQQQVYHSEIVILERANLTLSFTIILLVVATALLALCTQFATDNLQGLVSQTAATNTFVGLIVLPLLTVDPSTIKVAMEDKQDQNINSNLGANIQSTLVVIPFMVLLGWMLGIEFALVFDTVQLAEVAISTMIVQLVTAEGKSTW